MIRNQLWEQTATVLSSEYVNTRTAPPVVAPTNVGGGDGKVGELHMTWTVRDLVWAKIKGLSVLCNGNIKCNLWLLTLVCATFGNGGT